MAKVIRVWDGTKWQEVGVALPIDSINGGNANTIFSGIINGGNAI